jgi:hypothetical protein
LRCTQRGWGRNEEIMRRKERGEKKKEKDGLG